MGWAEQQKINMEPGKNMPLSYSQEETEEEQHITESRNYAALWIPGSEAQV